MRDSKLMLFFDACVRCVTTVAAVRSNSIEIGNQINECLCGNSNQFWMTETSHFVCHLRFLFSPRSLASSRLMIRKIQLHQMHNIYTQNNERTKKRKLDPMSLRDENCRQFVGRNSKWTADLLIASGPTKFESHSNISTVSQSKLKIWEENKNDRPIDAVHADFDFDSHR